MCPPAVQASPPCGIVLLLRLRQRQHLSDIGLYVFQYREYTVAILCNSAKSPDAPILQISGGHIKHCFTLSE